MSPGRWVRGARARRRDERGSMAVEVVLMMPVLFAFTLLVVAGGRYVTAQADVQAVARDAARAASFERSYGAAYDAATRAVAASVPDTATCAAVDMAGTRFEAGGIVQVSLECRVSNQGLGLIGLSGSVRITGDAAAPLDTYRRTE